MPQPNVMHIDAPLTNLSVAFEQQDEQFIFDKVFPIVPVDNVSGLYWSFPEGDWLRDEAQRRAPGTESAGGGFGVTDDNYSCTVYAYHKDLDDQTVAASDSTLQLATAATSFVTARLRMRQERQFIADYFNTGIWGTDLQGVANGSATPGTSFVQWSDTNNSHPIADIKLAKRLILSKTGYAPNKLVLGYDTYDALTVHPDILDRIKYTSPDAITTDILARYFDVDQVLVSQAVYNSAAEGLTAVTDFSLGASALLCYAAPAPGLDTPSAGYTFRWTGISGGLGQTIGVSSFRMEHLKSDRIEGQIAFDNKVVSATLGVYLYSAVANPQ
jgi:hypothetical protein